MELNPGKRNFGKRLMLWVSACLYCSLFTRKLGAFKQNTIARNGGSKNLFPIASGKMMTSSSRFDTADCKEVIRAINDLQIGMMNMTGVKPGFSFTGNATDCEVIIGAIKKSNCRQWEYNQTHLKMTKGPKKNYN